MVGPEVKDRKAGNATTLLRLLRSALALSDRLAGRYCGR
jgi:hypothetical protein